MLRLPSLLSMLLLSWAYESAQALHSEDLDELETRIRALTAGQKATYGIAFRNLNSGQTLFINERDQMHAASTMKVPVMMRIFEMIEAGQLSLNTPVAIKNEFVSIVDGSTFSITVDSEEQLYGSIGRTLPLEDLLYAMITKSSNLATNLLIELADASRVTQLMRELGARNIQVRRGVEDLKAFDRNLNNECNAGDMLAVMVACATSLRFPKQSRRNMLAILREQAFRDVIPNGIPENSGALVANKTGAISRAQHDAAIVDLPDGTRYVLVIFARDFEDQRAWVKQTGRKISALIYKYLTSESMNRGN